MVYKDAKLEMLLKARCVVGEELRHQCSFLSTLIFRNKAAIISSLVTFFCFRRIKCSTLIIPLGRTSYGHSYSYLNRERSKTEKYQETKSEKEDQITFSTW